MHAWRLCSSLRSLFRSLSLFVSLCLSFSPPRYLSRLLFYHLCLCSIFAFIMKDCTYMQKKRVETQITRTPERTIEINCQANALTTVLARLLFERSENRVRPML
eukprot:sb/3478101/